MSVVNTTLKGHNYFLTIVNDIVGALLRLSNENEVICNRIDNGHEFAVPSFFACKCVVHQLTCVDTQQQNAVIKRKYQYI